MNAKLVQLLDDCWVRAVHTFGTAAIFEKRAEIYQRRVRRPRPMTDSEWWSHTHRAATPREQPPMALERVFTFHHGTHEATLDVRCVPAMGHELLLSFDGEWRRGRVFRRQQPLEMIEAIAATMAQLEAKGWA